MGPAISEENDVAGRHDSEEVIFGRAYCTLGRERTMVVGRVELDVDERRLEE
jgi:hypothetical protein